MDDAFLQSKGFRLCSCTNIARVAAALLVTECSSVRFPQLYKTGPELVSMWIAGVF
jgi:hypothetical protein